MAYPESGTLLIGNHDYWRRRKKNVDARIPCNGRSLRDWSSSRRTYTYRGNELKNKNNEIEIQQQLSFRFFFLKPLFRNSVILSQTRANDAHLTCIVSLNQRIKNHCYPWDFGGGGALSREDNSRWVVDHNDLEAVKTRKEFCFC